MVVQTFYLTSISINNILNLTFHQNCNPCAYNLARWNIPITSPPTSVVNSTQSTWQNVPPHIHPHPAPIQFHVPDATHESEGAWVGSRTGEILDIFVTFEIIIRVVFVSFNHFRNLKMCELSAYLWVHKCYGPNTPWPSCWYMSPTAILNPIKSHQMRH